MQIFFAAATNAASTITFPDFDLDVAGMNSVVVERGSEWYPTIRFGWSTISSLNLNTCRRSDVLLPNIDEVKESVVGPNSRANLLKDLYPFCFGSTRLETPNSVSKKPILRQSSTRQKFRLIGGFPDPDHPWFVEGHALHK